MWWYVNYFTLLVGNSCQSLYLCGGSFRYKVNTFKNGRKLQQSQNKLIQLMNGFYIFIHRTRCIMTQERNKKAILKQTSNLLLGVRKWLTVCFFEKFVKALCYQFVTVNIIFPQNCLLCWNGILSCAGHDTPPHI